MFDMKVEFYELLLEDNYTELNTIINPDNDNVMIALLLILINI